MNFCCIELPYFKSDIDILKSSISDLYIEKCLVHRISSSALSIVNGSSFTKANHDDCQDTIDIIFEMFDCNRLHNFGLNLNQESFL